MSDDWNTDDLGNEDAFASQSDAFGRQGPASTNPLITRAQDAAAQSPLVSTDASVPRPKARVAVVGAVGADGQMLVARHRVDGLGNLHALERPRLPTADEYNSVMFNGKLVQGGVVAQNVPTGTNYQNTVQRTPLGEVGEKAKRWALWGALGIAAAGFGYVGYKYYKGRDLEDDVDDLIDELDED